MAYESGPPAGSQNWHFFQLLAYAMEAGLGKNTFGKKWSNAELSKISGNYSRNAIGVKSIEAWRNGTDLPLHHLDTLLEVFTSGLSDDVAGKWVSVFRHCIIKDRSLTRQDRQNAYRALRSERQVLSQSGHGLIPTHRQSGILVGLLQNEVYFEAGLEAPQSAMIDFQSIEDRRFGDLPASQFILQLVELNASENLISEALSFFGHKSSGERTLALTHALDTSGLLTRSWKLRRSVASAISTAFENEDGLTKVSSSRELHQLTAGSLLSPLLVGPLSQRSFEPVANFLEGAPDTTEANPQLHWEISRHLSKSKINAHHFPVKIKPVAKRFGSVDLETSSGRELHAVERLLLRPDRVSSSGGRYGLATKELLTQAEVLDRRSYQNHVLKLSGSKHEGVRWSIVRVLGTDVVRHKLGDDLLKRLVFQFSRDENPWVLREVMSALNSSPIIQVFEDKRPIFENLRRSIQDATNEGVPSEELMPEFLSLCSKWPETLYMFNSLLR